MCPYFYLTKLPSALSRWKRSINSPHLLSLFYNCVSCSTSWCQPSACILLNLSCVWILFLTPCFGECEESSSSSVFFFFGGGVFFSVVVIIFAGIHFCSGAMYFCGDLSICWGSFSSVLFCSFIQLVLVMRLFLLCTVWKNYFLLLFCCCLLVVRAYIMHCTAVTCLLRVCPAHPSVAFFLFFLVRFFPPPR